MNKYDVWAIRDDKDKPFFCGSFPNLKQAAIASYQYTSEGTQTYISYAETQEKIEFDINVWQFR